MCQAGVYIGTGMLTEHEPCNEVSERSLGRKFDAQDPDERRWFTKLQHGRILNGFFSSDILYITVNEIMYFT